MVAGESASWRADELESEADALLTLSTQLKVKARNYRAAAMSEATLAHALREMSQLGWVLLEDRLWPGSRRANVDFILVGPGGVVVVDAKAWRDAAVVGGKVWRGQDCVDDEADNATRLIDSLAEGLEPHGLTSTSIRAMWCLTSVHLAETTTGPITLLGEDLLIPALLRLPQRFTPEQVTRVAQSLSTLCPSMTAPAKKRQRRTPDEMQAQLPGIDDLTDALVQSELSDPIEDWMTFLHPEQVRLTRNHWSGPARVRGPAGTGKTVVGLHRATHLALRSPHPILFTSFVRTLPTVFAALAERVSPTAAANIEFINVHRFASQCLETAGERPASIDITKIDSIFSRAWAVSELRQSPTLPHSNPLYWREEIDHVIKGRGLDAFEQYRNLARLGRKTAVRLDDRRRVWALYIDYERRLARRGLEDFNNLIARAHNAVRQYPDLFRYGGVVIDEFQDLNLITVQFLDCVSGDGANRLLILGDSRQSVYPGGFTLAEAGINVQGRAHILERNYRNSAEIVGLANSLVAHDDVLDIDGASPVMLADLPERRGAEPIAERSPSLADLLNRAVAYVENIGRQTGNTAILTRTSMEQRSVQAALRKAQIPFMPLNDYTGLTSDAVKVGTIKRAKGLEFASVLLPGIHATLPRRKDEPDECYAERVGMYRREIYVAMTRARDRLWVGYLDPAAS